MFFLLLFLIEIYVGELLDFVSLHTRFIILWTLAAPHCSLSAAGTQWFLWLGNHLLDETEHCSQGWQLSACCVFLLNEYIKKTLKVNLC